MIFYQPGIVIFPPVTCFCLYKPNTFKKGRLRQKTFQEDKIDSRVCCHMYRKLCVTSWSEILKDIRKKEENKVCNTVKLTITELLILQNARDMIISNPFLTLLNIKQF